MIKGFRIAARPRNQIPNLLMSPDVETSLKNLRSAHDRLKGELRKAIVGQDEVIDQLLLAILARGHCLLVGVPGLAKTLLIQSLSEALDLDFQRDGWATKA